MLADGLSVDEDVAVERAGGEVEQALLARRYRDLFGVEPRAAAAGLAGRAEVGIPAGLRVERGGHGRCGSEQVRDFRRVDPVPSSPSSEDPVPSSTAAERKCGALGRVHSLRIGNEAELPVAAVEQLHGARRG
eukprot:COSAG04_NODE_12882_length_630_cov_1.261770_1_plen_132_part_10